MANLNSAFVEAATEPPLRDPPRGNGEPANGNAEAEIPTGERSPFVLNRHEQLEIGLHRLAETTIFVSIWTTDGENARIRTTLITIDIVLPHDEEKTPIATDISVVLLRDEERATIEEDARTKIETSKPATTTVTMAITIVVTVATTISEIREPTVEVRATMVEIRGEAAMTDEDVILDP